MGAICHIVCGAAVRARRQNADVRLRCEGAAVVARCCGPFTCNRFLCVLCARMQLPTNQVAHCFPMGTSPDSAVVEDGLTGVLDSYFATVDRVLPAGPSKLSVVLRTATRQAREHRSDTHTIVAVLT